MCPVRTTFAKTIQPWAFTFEEWFGITRYSETHLVAANADFTKLIDGKNPTTPGSLVHFWLTGLGPLDKPVPTAEPAPADPVSRPLAKLFCTISNSQSSFPLEVFDVVYAPNLIGVYQVDIRIPASWSTAIANIRCSSESSPSTGGLIAVEVRK
ncbi:MAG: hypothetical protein FJW36_19630 [Acidobacteria bacterium]|nr:hypothetical protein [Acidobacteriota bacterium]